jgi:hypothetical protein
MVREIGPCSPIGTERAKMLQVTLVRARLGNTPPMMGKGAGIDLQRVKYTG